MRNRQCLELLQASVCSLLLLLLVFGVVTTLTLVTPSVVTAQNAEDNEGGEDAPPSLLGWMFDALGIGYSIIFLSLSFTLVAIFIMNLMMARRESVVPVDLVHNFESRISMKKSTRRHSILPKQTNPFWDRCSLQVWENFLPAMNSRSKPCRKWAKRKP